MDWKWSLMTLLMIDTITLEEMSKWNSIIAFKMDCLVLLSKSVKVACKNKTVGCFFSLFFSEVQSILCIRNSFSCKRLAEKVCGGVNRKD